MKQPYRGGGDTLELTRRKVVELNPALAHKPKSEQRISHSDFFLAFERVKARLHAKAVAKNDRNSVDLFDATMISVTAFCDLMAMDLWEKGKPKIEVVQD